MDARELYEIVTNSEDVYEILEAVQQYIDDADTYDSTIGSLEELLTQYVDEDIVIEEIHNIDDLTRLYYFLGDTDLLYGDLFYINTYGNLENADVGEFRSSILDIIGDYEEDEENYE